jgi:pyruvate/2-oxoglutarate dehydrogenase complex dihydrolipoamide acyltransferase (E2) component
MSATEKILWQGDGAAVVSQWFFDDGDAVAEGDLVCELMQDKAIIEVNTPAAGKLHIAAVADSEVASGALLGWISQ